MLENHLGKRFGVKESDLEGEETKLSRIQEFSRLIHLVLRKCRDCDKKQFKSSTDSQVSRRCRDCLKTVFHEGKNIDMKCNKECSSTKDPINILNSQNHLLTTILSTMIPKTHIHTHTHTHTHTQQV